MKECKHGTTREREERRKKRTRARKVERKGGRWKADRRGRTKEEGRGKE